MKICNLNNKRQRGISLLEVMLSLAIIAVILTMAARYFGVVTRDSQLNQTIQLVGEVSQGVSKCATMGDGCVISTATLADMAAPAYGYLSPSTAALSTNPFGGSFSYDPATQTLTIGGLPTEACTKLAARFNPAGTCNGTDTFTFTALK